MRNSTRGAENMWRHVALLTGAGLLLLLQGTAWASSEGGGHHGLNWFDFFQRLVCFAILLGILVKLLKKPIRNFFVSRREEIQNLLAELEVKQKEAERKSAECKASLAALEAETRKIVSELIAEGEAEREKIIEAAKGQAAYIRQQAELSIQQEIKAARKNLQAEIGELSVAAAEEILRSSMQPQDHDRLVRDFMTRVAEAK